jgi:antitoxin MazE
MVMKVSVVQIGNSKGIRIPKPLLKQCEITATVDLRLEGNKIVLAPVKARPRQGWARAAKQMHEAGDDQLLIPDVFEEDIEVDW